MKLPFIGKINHPEGLEITCYKSVEDGTWVVEIDTPGLGEDHAGPFIRIYLNDGSLYENPPFPSGK